MPKHTYFETAGNRKLVPQAISKLRPSQETGKSHLEEKADAYRARRSASGREEPQPDESVLWSDPSLEQVVNQHIRRSMSLGSSVSGRFSSADGAESNRPRSPSIEQIRRGSERSDHVRAEISANGVLRRMDTSSFVPRLEVSQDSMTPSHRALPQEFSFQYTPEMARLGIMDTEDTGDAEDTSDAPEQVTPAPVQVDGGPWFSSRNDLPRDPLDGADLPQEPVREMLSVVTAQHLAAVAANALNSEVQQERSSTLLALRNALRRIS